MWEGLGRTLTQRSLLCLIVEETELKTEPNLAQWKTGKMQTQAGITLKPKFCPPCGSSQRHREISNEGAGGGLRATASRFGAVHSAIPGPFLFFLTFLLHEKNFPLQGKSEEGKILFYTILSIL